MRKTFGLRQRIMLVIVFFMMLIFVLIQTQHSGEVEQIVIDAEKSRNTILVETIIPIVKTNLAFDLIDSNREYLDTIARQNDAIIAITLNDPQHRELYNYVSESFERNEHQEKSFKVTKTITDEATQQLLGTITLRFSHQYYDAIIKQYESFAIEYFFIFLLILFIMFVVLRSLTKPFNAMLEQIKRFDPQKDNYILDTSEFDGELGIIQNALIEMIKRIETYHAQLSQLNATLEYRVSERTQELASEVETVKKQEKMLIAQSRLAAMGEMMSMIAHQWRQPLSTSSLMITQYQIDAMLEGRESDKRDEILDAIAKTLMYLSETIDDFQTYFKPDKQKQECYLDAVIERALSFAEVRMGNHNIRLIKACDERLKVMSYFNELVQILLNLLNNAIDAIESSQNPKREIVVRCERFGNEVALHVSDTGGGIDEAIIESVFEPYFSTKGKNGTGLGLYMAKMIVERHLEGSISVRNSEDGASFTIRFSPSLQPQDSH